MVRRNYMYRFILKKIKIILSKISKEEVQNLALEGDKHSHENYTFWNNIMYCVMVTLNSTFNIFLTNTSNILNLWLYVYGKKFITGKIKLLAKWLHS